MSRLVVDGLLGIFPSVNLESCEMTIYIYVCVVKQLVSVELQNESDERVSLNECIPDAGHCLYT
jgi:hypothetical protein